VEETSTASSALLGVATVFQDPINALFAAPPSAAEAPAAAR